VVGTAGLTLLAVLLIMAGEAALSAFNERVLLNRGACESSGERGDDGLHRLMRVAYPSAFAAMAIEGAWFGPASPRVLAAGLVLFGLSKALKLWAITALGVRWTFRVLVLPGQPLVSHGPYAFMRHPNYLAIIGEMIGVAMIVSAPVMGLLAVIGYGALLRRKIAVEERALGRQ
jgi:methyltransferase